jgi:predicted nucleic acid-binding protein
MPERRVPKVLDSWILLGWLKDQEPRSAAMELLWSDARDRQSRLLMDIVNVGEVYYLTAKAKDVETAEWVLSELQRMPLEIHPAFDPLVIGAARFKARFPISYAGAFAAATAAATGAVLVTGDPEMRRLEAGGLLRLEWVGRQ